jgi:hypothetical protein
MIARLADIHLNQSRREVSRVYNVEQSFIALAALGKWHPPSAAGQPYEK